jgi:hypothetical protein
MMLPVTMQSGPSWSHAGSPPQDLQSTKDTKRAKVGTSYFFPSLFPLVCYLEIVLPLHASPLFRYRYFYRSALAALPLVRYSATAIFSIVHTFNVVFSFSDKL